MKDRPGLNGMSMKTKKSVPHYAVTGLVSLLSFAFSVVLVSGRPIPDPRSDLDTLEGLVDRWLTLRLTIAEEQRAWDAHRAQWQAEIALLEREAETLEHALDEENTFAEAFETRRLATATRRSRLASELQDFQVLLHRAETDLRLWRTRLPPALTGSTDDGFNALPMTPQAAERLLLTRRAQIVIACYTQIETIQNGIHAVSETLALEGVSRHVDVLYVGLARAFAVSPANDWAAVGTPTDTGWVWSPSAEDAGAVRRAIDVLNRRTTAQLVALPLHVVTEEAR